MEGEERRARKTSWKIKIQKTSISICNHHFQLRNFHFLIIVATHHQNPQEKDKNQLIDNGPWSLAMACPLKAMAPVVVNSGAHQNEP